MKDKLEEIRERIAKRREELGLSYQELADATGLNRSTLQRYITGGIGNLGMDKLESIARALRVSPAHLMGWEDRIDNIVDEGTTRQEMSYALEMIYQDIDEEEARKEMREKGATEDEIERVFKTYEALSDYKTTIQFIKSIDAEEVQTQKWIARNAKKMSPQQLETLKSVMQGLLREDFEDEEDNLDDF